jgi:hypothetical protein
MHGRIRLALVLIASVSSMGAAYRSTNFIIEAPTEETAKQLAETAEAARKDLALKWLGKELPPFAEPCPIRVTLQDAAPGGATSIAFDRGQVLSRDMHVEGALERVRVGVLPHEITHVLFAEFFRRPIPRWADEGGAVLGEDKGTQQIYLERMRNILGLRPDRAIPLRRLFPMTDYPSDLMVLYAEGTTVSQFLVEAGGRKEFLDFVSDGMDGDWDKAVKDHYGWKDVDELEEKWRASLRKSAPPKKRDAPEAVTPPAPRETASPR